MALKNILFATIVASLLLMSQLVSAETRSYAQWQLLTQGPYGPIVDTSLNISITAEMSDDYSRISLSDGSCWYYYCDNYGNHHYKHAGGGLPNYAYDQIVFSGDYSQFSMYYSFGMMGMMTQMRSDWKYIGDGTQPAFDWFNH
ncbi:MAG: hypothetical protein K2O00_07570 [Muribaculaceae bacterium]|nr:hypothetical protein [Muribaculaceae bacterium]